MFAYASVVGRVKVKQRNFYCKQPSRGYSFPPLHVTAIPAVTKDEVLKINSRISDSKTPSLDGITNEILKPVVYVRRIV